MSPKFHFQILFLSLLLSSSIFCEEDMPEEISNIYSWAKENNIEISPSLTLFKADRYSPSHTFYFFKTKEIVPEGTTLLKMHSDIILSPTNLRKYVENHKNKKIANLWENLSKVNSTYLEYWDTKQLFYTTTIIENAVHKRKGNLYEKYKTYFNLYEDINMDNFPIFYLGKEIQFLAGTNLALSLRQAIDSLKEEYYILKNQLNISSVIEDNFMKFRILSLANSISNQVSETTSETIVVPFIDFFGKVVNKTFSNAEYSINAIDDKSFYFEIKTTKEIPKNSEIFIKFGQFSNQECLLFYGFVDENNYLAPEYYVDVFNRMFRKHMEVLDVDFSKVMIKETYELGSEVLDPDVIGTYQKLYPFIEKFKNKEEGAYLMQLANLNYYNDLYRFNYEDQLIENKLVGDQKIKNIKNIVKIEHLVVQNAIKKVKDAMNNFLKERKGKKEEKDSTKVSSDL